MLYLDLFCSFVSKMCPKVSEKPKKANKGVRLSIKLDIVRCVWYDLVVYFLYVRMLKNIFHIN